MTLSIADPIVHTYLIIGALIVALSLSLKHKDERGLSKTVTLEIKGFAVLAIIFAHVGYFLISDHRFLFPLSTLSGVGVDLFLILSGFGLTMSALSKRESVFQFYLRKLSALLIPFWLTLAALFVLDYTILGRSYDVLYVVRSFLGFFPHADIFFDINSPLWYFTLILFYYLLFPLLFYARLPLLSAAILYILTRLIVYLEPAVLTHVLPLYEVHLAAFPLGIVLGSLIALGKYPAVRLTRASESAILLILALTIGYLALHTGVGKEPWIAQSLSILTALLVILFFSIKQFEVRLLTLFGLYSFEIYLIHWPLMARYDVFFAHFPASVALAAYLAFFLAIAWCMQKSVAQLNSSIGIPR